MINIPKGTKDCLPKDSYKWQYIESTAREVAKTFGIKKIRTPIFEHTEVFLRGIGDTTDVVNKEMYTFNDKGGRSITLKPEGTAGVARSFVENGFASATMPLKLYYLTPCFRYERPQAGRLREFHQFGIEMFGSDSASIDAEVILMAKTFLDKIGVTGLKLYINSIGCRECRKNFNDALKEYLRANIDDMCYNCKDRYERNPLRILDCKEEGCKNICAGAPKILDYLCEDCRQHFDDLQNYLTLAGVDYAINENIVRGLDYYTKTVFEFVSENIGAQGTVCGGGRYDGLIKDLGGPALAGIGFAAGITRLILAMEKSGVNIENENRPLLYIASMGKGAAKYAMGTVAKLRNQGLYAETDLVGRSLKAQMKYADKKRAKYTLIIGDSELENNKAQLKNMDNSSQVEIELDDISKLTEILKM